MLTDPWGNMLAGEGTLGTGDYATFTLRSPGRTDAHSTADDINVQVAAQRVRPLEKIRRVAFNGQATVQDGLVAGGRVRIEGIVKDERGKLVASVKVSARRVTDGQAVWVYTDAQGRFTVSDLSPGRYHVTFESDTHHTTTYKTLTLAAGARGSVEPTLAARGPASIMLSVYNPYSTVSETVAITVDGVGGGRAFRREVLQRQAKELPVNGRLADLDVANRAAPLMMMAAGTAAAEGPAPADDERARKDTAKNEASGGGATARAQLLPRNALHEPGAHHRRRRARLDQSSRWPIRSRRGA